MFDADLDWSDLVGETRRLAISAVVLESLDLDYTGSPKVSGRAVVGSTLTGSIEELELPEPLVGASDLGKYRYYYQWYVVPGNDNDVRTLISSGTDATTYVLTAEEAGRKVQLSVRVDLLNRDDTLDQEGVYGPSSLPFPERGTIAAAATGGPVPDPSSSSVNALGDTVTLAFTEALDGANLPPAGAFRVGADAGHPSVTAVSAAAGNDKALALTVSPKIRQGAKVLASYYDPTAEDDANAVQDTDGNDAETFENVAITNGSTFANSPATGAPSISGMARVGRTLTASTAGIADADGLDRATFVHEWFRLEGARERAIPAATFRTYMPVEADLGKRIGVRVDFLDGQGSEESLRERGGDGPRGDAAGDLPGVHAAGGAGGALVRDGDGGRERRNRGR